MTTLIQQYALQPGGARFIRLSFRTTAAIEAITWVGMIASLALKYGLDGSALGVTVFGWIHGFVWIFFVLACLAAAIRFRWPLWAFPLGIIMSVLPFLTIPFDLWMERSQRLTLGWRQRRTQASR